MTGIGTAVRRARRSFYGWRIVGLMLGPRAGGTGVYILGGTLFVIPLEEALDLQRGVSSLLFALGALVSGIVAPVSGALMDRFGPRKVLIASVLISAGGYLLLASATNTALVFLFYIGVISPVVLNVAFNASSAFVNNWFDRSKATAMSLLQVGSGLGAIVIIPSLAFAIEAWGWRPAAIVAAAFLVALGLPAALLSRDTPEEMGLLPDGDTVPHDAPLTPPPAMSGLTTKEALRTPTFWLIVATVFTFGGAQAGVQIHFVPIMVWKGMNEVQGALILTVMALASTPIVLIMGWLADRFGRLRVAGVMALQVAAGVLILAMSDAPWTIWGAALIMAPNFGMYPLIWAALGQAFGRKAFSTIRGTIMAFQIGSIMGMPILAGFLFDRSGSYTGVLWITFALWVAAGTLMLLTRERTYVIHRSAPLEPATTRSSR